MAHKLTSPCSLVLRAFLQSWRALPRRGQVVLSVSGGVDSMVLLECAHLAVSDPGERSRIFVLHVNHRLRGSDAELDEALVLARAKELGFRASSVAITWNDSRPSQAAARKKRAEIMARVAPGSEDRIFFAHHANDQAETLFFRLLRGTGLDGLRGMAPVSGQKIRPFLGLEKSVLQAAAKEWRLFWREDRSNADPKYSRNWVRQLFPLVEERHPGFQRKLAALAAEVQALPQPLDSAIDLFAWEERIVFARPSPQVSSRCLKNAFQLNRQHAENVRVLLGKSSGQITAEGVRFFWSGGILLAERGRAFQVELKSAASAPLLQGTLGSWEINLPEDAEILLNRAGYGEKLKKQFQAARVPLFFRLGIPVLLRLGRVQVILPKEVSGRSSDSYLRFQPSSLGKWWLDSFHPQ